MAKLLYCLQCQKGVFDTDALGNEEVKYCPTCHKGLVYLGRETATISPPDIFQKYDAEHFITDYLTKFKGKVSHYATSPVDHDIIECEELLNYNPNNTEALFHMGMVYKSRAKLDLASHHFKRVITADPTHIEGYRQLAHISMLKHHYPKAVDYLMAIQTHEQAKPIDQFHLGVAYYFNNQKSQAITQFTTLNKTLAPCDMKTQVDALLSQLVQT